MTFNGSWESRPMKFKSEHLKATFFREQCSFEGTHLIDFYVDLIKGRQTETPISDRGELAKLVSKFLTNQMAEDIKVALIVSLVGRMSQDHAILNFSIVFNMLNSALAQIKSKLYINLYQSLLDIEFTDISPNYDYGHEALSENFTFRYFVNKPASQWPINHEVKGQEYLHDFKCIDIFVLSKIIYLKTILSNMERKSAGIVKRMILQGSENYISSDLLNSFRQIDLDECKYLLQRQITKLKRPNLMLLNKLVNIAEKIIEPLWIELPHITSGEIPVYFMPLAEAFKQGMYDNLSQKEYYVKPPDQKSDEMVALNIADEFIRIDDMMYYSAIMKQRDTVPMPRLKEPELESASENSLDTTTEVTDPDVDRTDRLLRVLTSQQPQDDSDLKALYTFDDSATIQQDSFEGRSTDHKYVDYAFRLEEQISKRMIPSVEALFPVERKNMDSVATQKMKLDYAVNEDDQERDSFDKAVSTKILPGGPIVLCAACNLAITNEGVHCFGVEWHLEHLHCSMCNKNLVDCIVALHRGLPMCMKHFLCVRTQSCRLCGKVIEKDQELILWSNDVYHSHHFACKICREPYLNEPICCQKNSEGSNENTTKSEENCRKNKNLE